MAGGDSLEGVNDGAPFGLELGDLVLGLFLLPAFCAEGVFGLGALVGGLFGGWGHGWVWYGWSERLEREEISWWRHCLRIGKEGLIPLSCE